MYKNNTVSVIVPAYNEEKLISKTLTTIPLYVDKIIVINDGSSDNTLSIIKQLMKNDPRIHLINHETNKGLGQSLIDGYVEARNLKMDITAVMAGDAQMNPDDLKSIISPIADGEADYTKGNRLLREEVIERMPTHRFLGNNLLTMLTKFATGYWHVIDPQCGYTAISLRALSVIPIQKMIKGYGYNAHILSMLNLNNFKVSDVEVEPIYGDEQSKIKLHKYIPMVSKLLLKLFIQRLTKKYLLREFHPLVFFYFFSIFNFVLLSAPLSVRLLWIYTHSHIIPTTTLSLLNFSFSMGMLSLFFGMWLDMEDNKRLCVR